MLHITFTGSGEGMLRQALREMGLRHRIVTLFDDLSTGPIDSLDPDKREAWKEANLRPPDYFPAPARIPAMPPILEGWKSPAEETKDFWSRALDAETCTVWFTRRISSEYCGFLGWMELAGSKTYDVVDVTDVKSRKDGRLIFSIGSYNHSGVDYEGLVARACPLTLETSAAYASRWKALKRENAALRVLLNGELVSAPIDFFDDHLLSFVTQNWQKAIRIVGDTLIEASDEHARLFNLDVLMARLATLVEAGRLQARGDLDKWTGSVEIRLPGDNG